MEESNNSSLNYMYIPLQNQNGVLCTNVLFMLCFNHETGMTGADMICLQWTLQVRTILNEMKSDLADF